MNVLILTGKFGMGHWSASRSLAQRLEATFPGAQVTVEDFLTYALPSLSEAMYRGFDLLVTHGSHLFNTYYKLTELGRPDARPPFEGLLLDRLVELLHLRQPDAVIATHPLCAQLVSRLREEEGLDLPLVTCITDVTAHPEWINRQTDCYLVPSREVRLQLAAKGVDPKKVVVTGIPVREEFRHLAHRRGGQERQLLIMGGGLGLLPKKESFYARLDALRGVHTTVITGKNQKLYDRLHGRFANIEVLGYTDRVSDYMARADLIVTKPGGITLFETIFAQLPLLTWPPTLEQERNNARWLQQAGIGWVADSMDCAEQIAALIADDKALAAAESNMADMRDRLEIEGLDRLMAAVADTKGACA